MHLAQSQRWWFAGLLGSNAEFVCNVGIYRSGFGFGDFAGDFAGLYLHHLKQITCTLWRGSRSESWRVAQRASLAQVLGAAARRDAAELAVAVTEERMGRERERGRTALTLCQSMQAIAVLKTARPDCLASLLSHRNRCPAKRPKDTHPAPRLQAL